MIQNNKHFTSQVLYHWSKVFQTENWLEKEYLLAYNWKERKKNKFIFYVSPCGNFLIKKSLLCFYGIPKEIAIPTRRHGCWLMQPFADISRSAQLEAWATIKKYKDEKKYKEVDFARRNTGMYGGKAVVFDW